jgi:hypothetical protein
MAAVKKERRPKPPPSVNALLNAFRSPVEPILLMVLFTFATAANARFDGYGVRRQPDAAAIGEVLELGGVATWSALTPFFHS